MKTICIVTILATLASITAVAFAEPPSEYVTKNPDGSIKTKGTYTRNSEGKVIRFNVVDSQGKSLYSEIPYYSQDGRIIRADRLLPDGSLDKVVVYLTDKAIVLDTSGKVVDTQGFSEDEFLRASKAEQGAAANP
jgi:hypothetical protein